jgi:formylglycine-generating enzyme required for sulfatase activity
VLLKVTKYDAGPYSVRVNAGTLSTNSAEATLAVVPLLTAPELVTQPGDQSVALGAEVTLSVQARGSGPLSYRWTKNGDSLSDGVRLSGSGSNTLHIANVQVNDAGNYRVRVSNLSGTVDSSHGRLTVVTNVAPRPGLVWIAPGTFVMGSPASEKERWTDETQHTVTLTKGFYLGKYAVTQGEYLALMGSNPSYFTTRDWNGNAIPPDLNRPVERVSWDEATNYCAHLTVQEQAAGRLPAGWVYRLPTESEREYACRAGMTTAFHYGNGLHGGMANFYNYYEYDAAIGDIYVASPSVPWLPRTTAVGSYQPNAWGLHDMHGNVWEWCRDWYGSYPTGNVTDPQGAPSGSGRVFRGGGWYFYAGHCRSAFRFYDAPSDRVSAVGFRVVLAPGQP